MADDTWGEMVRRAEELAGAGERRILGIAGLPGSGKSTLAQRLVEELDGQARLVPMDGFHLPNAELARLGRSDRKGAPDTFDVEGYLELLRQLRSTGEEALLAPSFSRELDEPVASAIRVSCDVPLVITEGNYLLLPDGLWAQVRGLLDEVWFVEQDEQTRVRRLVQRHVEFGKTLEAARAWVLSSDQENADLVATTRTRADRVVRLPGGD